MATPFPPILESQRRSIASGTPVSGNFRVHYVMPQTVDFGALGDSENGTVRGGHIQILIRRQISLESWATQSRLPNSPDQEIIYLNGNQTPGGVVATSEAVCAVQRTFVDIPFSALRGSFTAGLGAGPDATRGQTFTIQIRFGRSRRATDAAAFGGWRENQIANRWFGEWSNTQRMFVYAGTSAQIAPAPQPIPDTLMAGLTWTYTPVSEDPLAQARLTYWYTLPESGGFRHHTINIPFESVPVGSDGRWGATGRIELPISRLTTIQYSLQLITVNNSIFPDPAPTPARTIPVFTFGDPLIATPSITNPQYLHRQLRGEEVDDGVIVIRITPPATGAGTIDHRTFRINTFTLEGLLVDSRPRPTITPPGGTAGRYEVRDYSIEMGEEYAYITLRGNRPVVPLSTFFIYDRENDVHTRWTPQDYLGTARNLNFNSNSFFTTSLQQLRLGGNVQVRNFNPVTSDQITQTIGGKYPFYSRSGQMNYRTIGISALISMRLDPTRTFLSINIPVGRAGPQEFWNGDLVSRERDLEGRVINNLVLRRDDVYDATGLTRDQRRVRDPNNNENQSIESDEAGRPVLSGEVLATDGRLGPMSPFGRAPRVDGNGNIADGGPSVRRGREWSSLMDSDNNINIYSERKFREAVMTWLTNGAPKLFRSETEGNMIVMLTGVSFAPLRHDRLVYTLSATLTEIAEYNLRNLQIYDLVPSDFAAFSLETPRFRNFPEQSNSSPFEFLPM